MKCWVQVDTLKFKLYALHNKVLLFACLLVVFMVLYPITHYDLDLRNHDHWWTPEVEFKIKQ